MNYSKEELTVKIPTAATGCFLPKVGSELWLQDTGAQAAADKNQPFLGFLPVTLLRDGQQTGEVRTSASSRA